MENLQEYIAHPLNLGRQEADSLELLRDKYPYFQALHILIAKCHKNQNTFGYNKNLKLASLYAGDRKVLFNYINAEPEPIEEKTVEKTEEKVNENIETISEGIEEPLLVAEQTEANVENNEIEENSVPESSEVKSSETTTTAEEKFLAFTWDEELQAFRRVKKPEQPAEMEPEKKPIFEVVKKEEPTAIVEERVEPAAEKPIEVIEEKEEKEVSHISEEIISTAISPVENAEIETPELSITETKESIEKANETITLETPEAEEPDVKTEVNGGPELSEHEEVAEEIIVEPLQINEETSVELTAEPEISNMISDSAPLQEDDNINDEFNEDVEQPEEHVIIDEINAGKIEEEPIEINEWVPETEKQESTIAATDSDDGEQDFFKWLDNFALADTKKIKDEEPKTEDISKEEETVTEVGASYEEKTVAEHSPEKVEEDTFHSHLPLNFEEIEETEEEYDPAAWAEIAYDIQAFVKTPEVPEEKHFTPKKVSKHEIDDLLDRFIKKNPSISRPKAEFYKPENMARKSEEFHGEVASETLAQLFYKQGHLHKSLEIYEKLMLQNPDKKDIFAARIKSIKDELINRL